MGPIGSSETSASNHLTPRTTLKTEEFSVNKVFKACVLKSYETVCRAVALLRCNHVSILLKGPIQLVKVLLRVLRESMQVYSISFIRRVIFPYQKHWPIDFTTVNVSLGAILLNGYKRNFKRECG